MRITEIEVRDVLKIKYVHITPNGPMTIVGGRNAQGKTSFLNSIAMALGGEKLCPTKPIRKGASSGVVKVSIDGDESKGIPPSTVVRRFSLKEDGTLKSDMEIVSDKGYRAPKPQTLLNSIINNATFDPLYFASLPAKEQAESLRKLVGIDTAQHERARAAAYETRRVEGVEMRKLDGYVKSLPFYPEAPAEPVSASEIVAEMDAAVATNNANEEQRTVLRALANSKAAGERAMDDVSRKVESAKAALEEAKAEYRRIADKLAKVCQDGAEQAVKVGCLQDVDLAPFRARLDSLDKLNEVVRQNQKRAEVEKELEASKARYRQLSDEIEAIDAAVAAMYATAQWPVSGLGFDEDGVTYNGLPFAQCSDAEKLDVSVAMGFAVHPALKMLVIRNGSLLDEDSLAHVAALAEQNDGQVFVERVGEGSECHVVLRDGEDSLAAEEATEGEQA